MLFRSSNRMGIGARVTVFTRAMEQVDEVRGGGKMTSWPATRLRLPYRGSIKEGMWADTVIFDLARIQDRATFQEPTLPPEGIDYVLVNGQVVIDQGKHTGTKPGQILYGPGWRMGRVEK